MSELLPPGVDVPMEAPGGAGGGHGHGSPEEASSEAERKVVELINEATVAANTSEKLNALSKAQELLLHSKKVLLDNFLNEMMGFQKDRSQEVRKFVVGFIELVCKKDPDLLPDVIVNLRMMIGDEVVVVQKRVIQAMTHVYKVALGWISRAKSISENMEAVWTVVSLIKDIILTLLESENDGIRTYTVKFMEMLVVTQTHVEEDSLSRANDMSLSDVPLTLKIARPRKLEEEARQVFEQLVQYHGSSHISSANLMTCMGSMTNIAKFRPQFMPKVITALEMLQANLPPTLAKSQVSSVRKHLKNQLLALLKHKTAAENHFPNITTLLTDLGATREEVSRAMPKFEEMKRRARKAELKAKAAAERASKSSTPESSAAPSPSATPSAADISAAAASESGHPAIKKAKVEGQSATPQPSESEESEDEDDDHMAAAPGKPKPSSQPKGESAVDITERFILERMNPAIASEIVLRSMQFLPHEIPPQFFNTYTPIAAAGTEGQVKHVSRLLATQLTAAGIGPGAEEMRRRKIAASERLEVEDDEEEEEDGGSKRISTIGRDPRGGGGGGGAATAGKRHEQVTLLPAGVSGKKSTLKPRTLKLSEVTKPMDGEEKTAMMVGALKRILTSRTDDSEYNAIFCQLIKGVIERCSGGEREELLRRLYLESPIITEDAIDILKQFVTMREQTTAITVVNLMKDLVLKRPTKKLNFLNFLLEFCSHETKQVRDTANQIVLQLHANGDFVDIIEDYSVMYLRFLLNPTPPAMLFGEDRGRPLPQGMSVSWTEEVVRVCLYLFMSLLPQSRKLLRHLAGVYSDTIYHPLGPGTQQQHQLSVQRTILRELDAAVKDIPMDSPELLELVENCPDGSETLVTRIVHILTGKAGPPPALVEKFRDLYRSRNSDVRLLIPVLTGLTKQEIATSLPDLIQLSQGVVKEVLARLLGTGGGSASAPYAPADLLIALHLIDVSKAKELVLAVKTAIDLCFQQRKTFTQEVLSIALQQLLEEPNVPFFLMRTIIQALKLYPKMVTFVVNALQKLILKQVWKQEVIWKGWIKTCQETVPASYVALLQLPPPQLSDFMERVPSLRDPLLVHVQNLSEAQRAHVSNAVMSILYNVKPEAPVQEAEDEAADSGVVAIEPASDAIAPPGE